MKIKNHFQKPGCFMVWIFYGKHTLLLTCSPGVANIGGWFLTTSGRLLIIQRIVCSLPTGLPAENQNEFQ